MTAPTPGPRGSQRPLTRRSLIAAAGLTAAATPAAALLARPASAAAATAYIPAGTAPVPPPAKGPAIPKSGYLVQEIAERTYWLTDGLYQMLFLVTAEGVVAIDAPPTIGNDIPRAIANVTTAPVTHAVYSHHHADHTGAMTLYEGARFYAQREVTGLLRQAGDPNRPLPDVTFDNELTVTAGGGRGERAPPRPTPPPPHPLPPPRPPRRRRHTAGIRRGTEGRGSERHRHLQRRHRLRVRRRHQPVGHLPW